MKKLRLIFFFGGFFFFSTQAFAASMNSETYSLEKGEFSTGGFVTGTSETYKAGSTFGETFVGRSTGSVNQGGGGFQDSGTASESSGGGDTGGGGSGGSGGNSSSGGRRSIFYNLNAILQNINVYVTKTANDVIDNIKSVTTVNTGTITDTDTDTDTDAGLSNVGNTSSEDYTLSYASYTLSDISKNRPGTISLKDIIAIFGLVLVLVFILWRFHGSKNKQ